MSGLKAVIFDWAGTTVDFGCFAPTKVFVEVFRQKGIEITIGEARTPMGMHKKDHISEIIRMPRVEQLWLEQHGTACTNADVEDMYASFLPLQLDIIGQHSDLIPELPFALREIRQRGLKIGSTTGYNQAMMDIVMHNAVAQGYIPDVMVCATDVSVGRPAPWMAFKTAERLGVYPMKAIVKIGDTKADILEGIHAGMWSVGVVDSSNEMGLTMEELKMMEPDKLHQRREEIRQNYFRAGAHFVIDTLNEIPRLIESIEEKLANNEKP